MLLQSLRRHLRAPGFAVAVLLLLLAVTAINGSLFSAWWGLTQKPLPYADETSLLELRIDLRDIQFQVGLSPSLQHGVDAQSGSFVGTVGFPNERTPRVDAAGLDWQLQRISFDFSAVLGVQPALGRAFADVDAREGAAPVLLISDQLWRQRFAGASDIVGRSVRLGGREMQVVGVMPAGFAFPDRGIDAWTPYISGAAELAQDAGGGFGDFSVAARLATGVGLAQARSSLQLVLNGHPGLARLTEGKPDRVQADVRPWRERVAGSHGRILGLLQLAALLLALAVAANLVNLSFDRCLARQREFAICRALGSSRRHTLWALWADLLPPALAGMALGLLLIPYGIKLLQIREVLPADFPATLGLDLPVLIWVLLLTALMTSTALLSVLRTSDSVPTQRVAAGGMGRARAGMLVLQVGLSTLLLGGAGLLLHSAWKLLGQDRGFDPAGVLLTSVDLLGANRDRAEGTPTELPSQQQLQAEITALPGVQQVAVADMTPFSGADMIGSVQLDGMPSAQEVRSPSIGPGYFAALATPLLAGREFRADDRGAGSPVIVDELFRQRWLGERSPLTTTLRLGEGADSRLATIVGVVPTSKFQALDEQIRNPTVYQLMEEPGQTFFLLTRTNADPATLLRPLRERVLRLAPDAHLSINRPLTELIGLSLNSRRALLEVVWVFALVTLMLTAAGLYAVLSATVRRRTTELGVRQALGASGSRIQRLVLQQAGVLIAAGLLLGLGGGIVLARLLVDQLHDIGPADPLTWLVSVSAVAVVALLACWWPARRATRIPPAQALGMP